jgi:hypothetical protein
MKDGVGAANQTPSMQFKCMSPGAKACHTHVPPPNPNTHARRHARPCAPANSNTHARMHACMHTQTLT